VDTTQVKREEQVAGRRAGAWAAAAGLLALVSTGAVINAVGAARALRGGVAGRPAETLKEALSGDTALAADVASCARAVLVGALGGGAEEVLRGRAGWLFFRPAVESVAGPAFLAPRPAGGRHADPRPAVLSLHRQLRERGIALVLLPAPAKVSVHPERLAPGSEALAPLRNPSFAAFVAEMRAAGVLVLDCAPALVAEQQHGGEPLYLATDTHWRPRAVELVAAQLATLIGERVALAPVDDPGYTLEETEVEHHGDLVAMLRLPAGQDVFPPERVAVRQVVTADDLLWRPERDAEVLLLGDSFANVYSLAALGWGDGAGLAEHLSYRLGRPVDALTRNDDAAYATRLMLAQELARGRDRLAGKRVVVWEFAERELALGDWREIDLALAAAPPRRLWAPACGARATVTGTILEMGTVPRPRGAPYADHVAAVHMGDLESADADVAGREAVVFVRTMVDYTLTPAAAWRLGQRVTLRVSPWAEVGEEVQSMMRSELSDPELMFAEPCWGEVAQ
jgi:alginate O-acetyltransferase complex protein AlgJ